jgi:hypothetical protein
MSTLNTCSGVGFLQHACFGMRNSRVAVRGAEVLSQAQRCANLSRSDITSSRHRVLNITTLSWFHRAALNMPNMSVSSPAFATSPLRPSVASWTVALVSSHEA